MSELGDPAARSAGAVAIILLVVLLVQHQLLSLVRSTVTRTRKRAFLVAIVPLLPVYVFVAVVRLIDIASMHR